MSQFGLTDDERAELIALLSDTIAADRFPLSPRIKRLRAILEKLGVGHAPAMPYDAPRPSERPSVALARKRRR